MDRAKQQREDAPDGGSARAPDPSSRGPDRSTWTEPASPRGTRRQRDIYAVVEDCNQTLDPDVADLFDREANVFASEVLFQLDAFNQEAEGDPFSIKVPLKLSEKYGASVYASIRRYVSGSARACAVLIPEPPELVAGDGFSCRLRRVVPSQSFVELLGE